jgi:hypothetical protein
MNAEYAKTRGFDDAVIEPKSGGTIRITYRKGSGSAMWMRKDGIGPFTAYVPRTPNNMAKLASMYRDRLWRIVSAAVDEEVKAISDKGWAAMTEAERQYNEDRIAATHTGALEKTLDGATVVPRQDNAEFLRDRKKSLDLRERDLKEREARIAKKEVGQIEKIKGKIEDGEMLTKYSEEYLTGLSWEQLRSTAKTLGVKISPDMNANKVRAAILAHQASPGIMEESVAS